MGVRIAKPDEVPEIMSILEGGLLEVSSDEIRAAVQLELVRVYVDSTRIIGVVVTRPTHDWSSEEYPDAGIHIDAIAVRPNRRNQGIGRELIEEILACHDSATVTFEGHAKPFYRALNVSILKRENNTYLGVLEADWCQDTN